METQGSPARSAKEQFDRQATHYNAQWNRWTEATLHWLLEKAECTAEDTVLDVATGTGFTALAFAPRVRSVVGLDVSTGMLEQARQKAEAGGITNTTWVEGAAEEIPFPDGSFSIVTVRVAPHHFLSIPRFLAEVARVLKPGGRFLLADTCVPDNDPVAAGWQNRIEAMRDPSHIRNLTPSEWRRAIEQAGLDIVEMGEAVADIQMTLGDWLIKSGCTGEAAEHVWEEFRTAPQEAKVAYQIVPSDDGNDISFAWMRVVASAVL